VSNRGSHHIQMLITVVQMKISYDTLAKAVYIELEKRKAARDKEFTPGIFLDFDYKGELIGVELLNPLFLADWKEVARST